MATVVNGVRIENETIRQEAERMRSEYERVFADVPASEREARLQEWARDNAIEQTLLEQAAKADLRPVSADEMETALVQVKERHGASDVSDEALRADVELHLRVRRLLDEAAKDLPPASDEAVRRFYSEHLEEFTAPERIHAAHIVKNVSPQTPPEVAEAALVEVRKELEQGADFATLAARHSDCPENGGDLGWFARGRMVEEFEHTIFRLRPGQVSHVFATRFGFHVVKVYDHKPAGPCGLAEVEEHIRERLAAQARSEAVEKFLDDLRAKAVIEEAP